MTMSQIYDASHVASTPLSGAAARPGDTIRPLRTSGELPPLFCVFPGPPGARQLADALPADLPVYEFAWPNLDGASHFPAVEELALQYIDAVRRIQPAGPYRLCGYSKGGLIAYEMARVLVSRGEEVSFLALLETWHPQHLQNLTYFEFLQFRLQYLSDRLLKYGRDLISGDFNQFRARVHEWTDRRIKLLFWRATRLLFRGTNRSVPKPLQHVESIVTLKSFIPKPYPNRFMLIRTEDSFEKKLKDQTFGWHICCPAGVDIDFISGEQDHGNMIRQPYVKGLVDKIAPRLVDIDRGMRR
jgi:thioesterase domain-containing protein